MSLPTLSTLVTDFFLRHLAAERNVSPHTTTAYRDALKLFLPFAVSRCHRAIDQLTIHDLTAAVVLEFLADLEMGRGNTIRTCNARLAALQMSPHASPRWPASAIPCSRSPPRRRPDPALGT